MEITSDLDPTIKAQGKILDIESGAGSMGGAGNRFGVSIIVVEDSEQLRPGTSVRCRILAAVRRKALAVPKEYILFREGEKFCKIRQGGEVVEVPVRTGVSDEEYVEIISGLQAGQTVVRYKPIRRDRQAP